MAGLATSAALSAPSNGQETNVREQKGLVPEIGPHGWPMSIETAGGVFLGDGALTVVNQQEAAAWYKSLRDSSLSFKSTNILPTVDVFVTGDSKPSFSDPTDTIISDYAEWRGFGQVRASRFSVGGENTFSLERFVRDMKASEGWPSCSAVVIDIGTNEQGPQAAGGRQSAEETFGNITGAIKSLRDTASNGRSHNDLSVILLGQTPANLTGPNYADELLMRELDTIYRLAAKETNSVFIDQRGRFPRPHADADWMDDLGPNYGNANAHPMYTMAPIRHQLLLDVLMPEVAALRWGVPFYQDIELDDDWEPYDDAFYPKVYRDGHFSQFEGMIRPRRSDPRSEIGTIASASGLAPAATRTFASPSSQWTNASFSISPGGGISLQHPWRYGHEFLSFDSVRYRNSR